MLKMRKASGFTLIELLVVVVIIGILAAIALPNFIGAQKKAKIAQVKSNMHTCQLASESYATDTAGNYSSTAGGLGPYYPGGSNSPGGTAGNYPQNPFSGAASPPVAGPGVTDVTAERQKTAGAQSGNSGDVSYDVIGTTSYAVLGFDDAGKSVAGNAGKELVLSNQ